MKFFSKRFFVVLAPVLGVTVLSIIVFSTSTMSDTATLRAQVQPVNRWRLGFHHVDVCQSTEPSMVGWHLNLGPLSVSRLQRWQPTQLSLTILTNATVARNSTSISE
jgi:hypothetical protein